MRDDNFAFWVALAVCLVMIVLVWPRQMPSWKYVRDQVCDYGTCVKIK